MKSDSFRNLEILERKVLGELRMKVSHTSNTTDLSQTFSQTMCSFFNEVLSTPFEIMDTDIEFCPTKEKRFILSKRLKDSQLFQQTWSHSNLPQFMNKAADTTWHRYKHLKQHPEKTNRKIRKANTLNPLAH